MLENLISNSRPMMPKKVQVKCQNMEYLVCEYCNVRMMYEREEFTYAYGYCVNICPKCKKTHNSMIRYPHKISEVVK